MDTLAAGLVVYSLQVALVVGLASLVSTQIAASSPTRLAFWRAVLAVVLLVALPGAGITPAPPMVVDSLGAVSAAILTRPAPGGWRWADGLVLAWIVGAAARLGWLALGLLALARMRRQADDTPVAGAAGNVHWHGTVGQPVSFGWTRPVILLPMRLRALPAEFRACVIAHEARHVARGDWTWHLLEEIVHAVLWFHPGIWWTVDRIRLYREQVVDGEVATAMADRRPYMEALVTLAETPHVEVPAPGFGDRRHLAARLRVLAAGPTDIPRQTAGRVVLVVTLAAAAVAACALPWQQPVYSTDEPGLTLPVKIRDVRPRYTSAALKAGIEGAVLLSGVVTTDGTVEDVRVVESLDTQYGLDEQASLAIRQWRFEPGTRNGEPVPVEVTFMIRFDHRPD